MMKSVLPVIFLAGICCSLESHSQSVDVDLFTGQAVIDVPLWNLQSGSLSHPISLSYPGGGIRLLEGTGSFGTGWVLSAGGEIARIVKGLPDDYLGTGADMRTGWLHNNTASLVSSFVPSADENYSIASDEQSDFDFLTDLGGFEGSLALDTEPDVFIVKAPGLGGKFVFDGQGVIRLTSGQPLSIEHFFVDQGSSLYRFIVTNDDGVKYYFGRAQSSNIKSVTDNEADIIAAKKSYYFFREALQYKSSWQLTRIEAPNGDFLECKIPISSGRHGSGFRQSL